ncbi:MAG: hypothetical protein Q4F99_03060 [bacterium]|nr:hypothetical protein [bacterium]
MKSRHVKVVGLSALGALFCCGCLSVAQQLTHPLNSTRWAGDNAYQSLSQAEKAEVQQELAHIAQTDSNTVHRYLAVQRLEDQTVLAEVVQQETHHRIRAMAFDKISDEALLAKFAREATDEHLRQRALVFLSEAEKQRYYVEIAKSTRALVECQAALEKIEGVDRLADVAQTAASPEIRTAACQRLPVEHPLKQAYYAQQLKTSSVVEERLEAVRYLMDQEVLAVVAQTDREPSIRAVATQRLTDPSTLERIAQTEEDATVRRIAVEKLSNQALLAEIAQKDSDTSIRAFAVSRVKDANILAIIAKNEREDSIRKRAVMGVVDQALLATLAQKDSDASIRLLAVEKVTQQKELATLAKHATDAVVRQCAVEKLTEPSALAAVAQTEREVSIRKLAVQKITDQTLLANIAQKDTDTSIRMCAVEKLTEPTALAIVAQNERDVSIRKLAVQKVTDQTLLATIAQKETDTSIRMCAVEKLTEPTALAVVAQNERDVSIRKLAVQKVTDQTLLATIAQKETNTSIRMLAIDKLTDLEVLAEIAKQEVDVSVRYRMVQRISDKQSLFELLEVEDNASIRNLILSKCSPEERLKLKKKIPLHAVVLDVKAGPLASGDYYLTEKHILDSTIFVPQGAVVTLHMDGNSIEDSDILVEEGGTLILKGGTLFGYSKRQAASHAGREFYEIRTRGSLVLEEMKVHTRVINHGKLSVARSKIGNVEVSLVDAIQHALTRDVSTLISNLQELRRVFDRLEMNRVDLYYSGIDNYGSCTIADQSGLETLFNREGATCTIQKMAASLVFNDHGASMTLEGSEVSNISNAGTLTLLQCTSSILENQGLLWCDQSISTSLENSGSAILTATALRTWTGVSASKSLWGDSRTTELLFRNKGSEAPINNHGQLSIREGSTIVNAMINNAGILWLSGKINADGVRINAYAGKILGAEEINGVWVPYHGKRIVVVDDKSDVDAIAVSNAAPRMFAIRLRRNLYIKEMPSREYPHLVNCTVVEEH